MFQYVEETRVVRAINVIDVPQMRVPHCLAIGESPEPSRARRIDRLSTKVAQKSDHVRFDHPARGIGSRWIGHINPEEGELSDVVAHSLLESEFD